MPFVTPALTPALPEFCMAGMICLILVIDVFLRDSQRHITYGLAQFALLATALLVVIGHAAQAVVTFDGHYVKDGLADVLKVTLCLVVAAVLLYSRDYLRDRDAFKGEFYILALAGVLGMLVIVSAHSFLTLYLGLELFSLSTYALVAFNRDSPAGSEAAIKYFVLGAIASGMLLYGISMIYGATKTLDIQAVSAIVAVQGRDNLLLAFGLVFLVVGIAFKLGAVPFHMWIPDVYHGASTAVTLYIGSGPKLAAFALTIRILVDGLSPLHGDWQPMLTVLATLSLVAGNLIAIAQTNIKRMLAYSTISHMGFLLLGVVAGTPLGYASALFYAIVYVLMAIGAFGIVIILSRAGFEAENIADFKGLNERNPWLALMMLLIMMSMAGVPLLVGFYAKLAILQAVVSAGLIWLAVLALVFSVIGAFYYLRVVKFMYFDHAEDNAAVRAPLDTQIVISTNGLLMVALGIYPTALMALCAAAFHL
ncbi:MAG: NADH-quinone oxidoreductase subunit NuoN [Gammaproteobacteria bacterium]